MMRCERTGKLVEQPLFDWADKDRRDANPTRFEAGALVSKSAFPGPAVDPELDDVRLTGLLREVFKLMQDGQWRTFKEIQTAIGRGSEAGISAMLRNLRSKSRGSHKVDRQRRGEPKSGLFEYRLIVNTKSRIII